MAGEGVSQWVLEGTNRLASLNALSATFHCPKKEGDRVCNNNSHQLLSVCLLCTKRLGKPCPCIVCLSPSGIYRQSWVHFSALGLSSFVVLARYLGSPCLVCLKVKRKKCIFLVELNVKMHVKLLTELLESSSQRKLAILTVKF